MTTRRLPLSFALAALAVAGAFACSSLEGISGGKDAADADAETAAADAATDMTDASVADAFEASLPFCDRYADALYCNDFDHGVKSTVGWKMTSTASLVLDDASVVSPPFAMLASITESDASVGPISTAPRRRAHQRSA